MAQNVHGNLCKIYWILNWYGAAYYDFLFGKNCSAASKCRIVSCCAAFWLVSHFLVPGIRLQRNGLFVPITSLFDRATYAFFFVFFLLVLLVRCMCIMTSNRDTHYTYIQLSKCKKKYENSTITFAVAIQFTQFVFNAMFLLSLLVLLLFIFEQ